MECSLFQSQKFKWQSVESVESVESRNVRRSRIRVIKLLPCFINMWSASSESAEIRKDPHGWKIRIDEGTLGIPGLTYGRESQVCSSLIDLRFRVLNPYVPASGGIKSEDSGGVRHGHTDTGASHSFNYDSDTKHINLAALGANTLDFDRGGSERRATSRHVATYIYLCAICLIISSTGIRDSVKIYCLECLNGEDNKRKINAEFLSSPDKIFKLGEPIK